MRETCICVQPTISPTSTCGGRSRPGSSARRTPRTLCLGGVEAIDGLDQPDRRDLLEILERDPRLAARHREVAGDELVTQDGIASGVVALEQGAFGSRL